MYTQVLNSRSMLEMCRSNVVIVFWVDFDCFDRLIVSRKVLSDMIRKYIEANLKKGLGGNVANLTAFPSSVLQMTLSESKANIKKLQDDSDHRFYCLKCNKSYKNKRHLHRHQKEECIDVEPRFKCDVCFSPFRRKYHLSRHMQNRHDIVQWFKDFALWRMT